MMAVADSCFASPRGRKLAGDTSSSLATTRSFFPVVLTTGPEGTLCSGRVGTRAPIRGPLPLLGSATGSQGPLRRMSQREDSGVRLES
jgi:hypothetical protein